jgi:hypothetical protein
MTGFEVSRALKMWIMSFNDVMQYSRWLQVFPNNASPPSSGDLLIRNGDNEPQACMVSQKIMMHQGYCFLCV